MVWRALHKSYRRLFGLRLLQRSAGIDRQIPGKGLAYYAEITCDNPAECTLPLPTGPFNIGSVDGLKICYSEEFEVPYEEEYLILTLGEITIVI